MPCASSDCRIWPSRRTKVEPTVLQGNGTLSHFVKCVSSFLPSWLQASQVEQRLAWSPFLGGHSRSISKEAGAASSCVRLFGSIHEAEL
jgi:hypothetical protein